MNEAGLKRKFNMAAYISKVDLVQNHGLPPAVQEYVDANGGKPTGGQATITDFFKKFGKPGAADTKPAKPAKLSNDQKPAAGKSKSASTLPGNGAKRAKK